MNTNSGSTTAVESRRAVLKAGAAITAATLAPGLMFYGVAHSRPAEEPASKDVRWGMLIDTQKCGDGCKSCVTACNEEHGLSGKTGPQDSQWIRKVDIRNLQTDAQHALPMLCQHCENPPCVDVCPTGASMKRADGIVLVDSHLCIGCRYCMMACPYQARSLVHEPLTDQKPDVPRGVGCVESCTFCVQRVDRDETPACVEACTEAGHNAMLFGDINNPETPIAKALKARASTEVRADLNLNTGVRYQGI
ncbi:MAG: 4Fe-4S dicluster domain-containing protein [Rhodocyclaceae bacterium]|nr:MAG: 4Fe-4S dicluster domain-containing protein [Rhodocyclaceae bacterium]